MRTLVLLFLCATMAMTSPLIGGDDHDKIAHQVVEITKTLRAKSIEDLRSYCIKVEHYSRKVLGQEDLVGGVHDYVWRLDEDACVKFILSKTLQHQELLNLDTFMMTVEPPKTFLSEEGHNQELGITDWAFRLDRTTLNTFAFTCERYVNEKSGKGMIIGGIHDYINQMSDSEVASYVIESVRQNTELDSYAKLDELSRKYGFIASPVIEGKAGGLHDYIWRESRETLERWALTSESHHRTQKNIHILGGLHDYISTMSKEQLVDYILKKVDNYPELDNAQTLDKLSIQYGFSQ